ncbi:MAG: SH3 domain-containing protein [Flavobacteriales bacterium]|jgi:hypothetical protein|tara:strand:+ start:856 stop:1593 length:738 start_codon:yes stop_codon:yes gene_type:complete
MRNFITLILILLIQSVAFSQADIAIIKDPDGYINIRKGQGINFQIIDTLFENDFFECDFFENSNWVKVTTWKGRNIEGFVHKSRIQLVEELSTKKQKELIKPVLIQQKYLANEFQKAWRLKDNKKYAVSRKKREIYSENKYDAILMILPNYLCSTNDTSTIKLFFEVLWTDKGSANEMPSFILGEYFVCNQQPIIDILSAEKNIDKKNLILGHIEWGLINLYDADEKGDSNDPKYQKLIKILNSI